MRGNALFPGCLAVVLFGPAAFAADADWPMYRHDQRLTGATSAKGNIVRPRVVWTHYLGAAEQAMVSHAARDEGLHDVDGDGTLERVTIDGRTLKVDDPSGAELGRLTVKGLPIGNRFRAVRLAPDRRGLAIVSFSHRMDTGEGEGYCFTFDRGARNGELAWATGPLTHQYSPTFVIDDVDGDGRPEIVNAPHYRVQIFDALSGTLKSEIPWDVGRNYGLLTTRPRRDGPHKDIFIVSDFVAHVDCIRFRDGKWVHAWGHKYFEPNAAMPRGREKSLHVGPNAVTDLDGDGRDEVAYMLADSAADGRWHLRIRDGETGRVKHDVPGIWLWSVRDLDGDGRCELVYTPTDERRPRRFCDLHVANLSAGGLKDRGVLPNVRPLMTQAELPPSVDTIADQGRDDLLLTDIDTNGIPEIVVARRAEGVHYADGFEAIELRKGLEPAPVWQFRRPGHRLDMLRAGLSAQATFVATIRDFDAATDLTVGAGARVVGRTAMGQPGGFSTTPIVVDLDGDGRNEVVVQDASLRIQALRFAAGRGRPEVLWSVPGAAMNARPGFAANGELCVQSADVDGDGRPDLIFAAEDENGNCSVVCADGRGRVRWRHAFEHCPWGGPQAGVNFWTFGRFSGRSKGCDIYVDWHRRSRITNEGCVLSGQDGRVLWNRQGLVAAETAMPFGGGMPAVADVNGDGVDDLVSMFWTLFASVSGKTGEPIFPPTYLPGPRYFNHWMAYSSPTLADLDGDGSLDVYLNSASNACGAFAAVKTNGTPMWGEFHGFDQGSGGYGAVADLGGDGKLEVVVPVTDGTLVCLDAKSGRRRWTAPAQAQGDVIAADVNGDGRMELLFSSRDGRMKAVRGTDGGPMFSVEAPGRPIAADVDGDGLIELLAVGPDGVLRIVGNDAAAVDAAGAVSREANPKARTK